MEKLTTKQEKMVREAEKLSESTKAENNAKLEQIIREQRLRRTVYESIVLLSDTVIEDVLNMKLNDLDVNSWWEVVEERFLGHICGFPTCSNTVRMEHMSLYRIDRKNKKIFERCTETQKFCSEECFLRSAFVVSQLDTEPLWIRGPQKVRKFNLNRPLSQESRIKQVARDAEDIEFVKEKLVTKLGDLHIGESADTDDEQSDNEAETTVSAEIDKVMKRLRERKGADTERKHVCNKNADTNTVDKAGKTCECSTSHSPAKDKSKDEDVLTKADKLAKLRAKYSKGSIKKPPIMVEAKPLDVARHERIADRAFEDLERITKEWVGKSTVEYLSRCGRMDVFESEAQSEMERVVMQFYAGDRRLPDEEPCRDVALPRVDNYDQAIARRDVLIETLSPHWRMLEREVGEEGCARKAYPLISTLTLNADNVNIEKADARVAVAFIFRLMAHCDEELLEEYFPREDCVSAQFANYLKAIDCPVTVFNRMVKHVIDQLTQSQPTDSVMS